MSRFQEMFKVKWVLKHRFQAEESGRGLKQMGFVSLGFMQIF